MNSHEKQSQGMVTEIGQYPNNHGVMSPPPAFPTQSPPPGQPQYMQQPPQAYSAGYDQQQPQMAYGQPTQGHPQNPQMGYNQPMQGQGQGQGQGQTNPMMQTGQSQQFQRAIAIPNLGMGPAPVDCPNCGQRAMTSISYHAGNTTHVWAGITFCFTWCLCFIPYMMNSLKDVQHRCGNCGTLLATWHKSGQVETHIHA